MTKEEKRIYDKAYRARRREQIAEYKAKYYKSNKDALKEVHKANREALKDGFYTVYYLPKHHYIGVTTRLKGRLWRHKEQGRDTSGCTIMYKFSSKREALDVERQLHEELGFNGGAWYTKK
jgi:hypothetical protein